jgi:hypothetical protein
MMNFPGTSRGRALGVVAVVSGTAGLGLTLVARVAESPAPRTVFGFSALVAGARATCSEATPALDEPAIERKDAVLIATVHAGGSHAHRSRDDPEPEVRGRQPDRPHRMVARTDRNGG